MQEPIPILRQRRPLLRFVFIRLFYSFLTVLAIATATFLLMKAIPGDPFQDEQAIPEECLKALRAYYGLEDPLIMQYFRYVLSVITFDFGPSLKYSSQTVNAIIYNGFPVSFVLGCEALFFAIPLGIFVGIFSAIYHNSTFDKISRIGTAITLSAPSFLIATTLQFFLAFYIPIFPIARFDTPMHTFLPAITLAIGPATVIAKLLRASAIEVLHQPYMLTAKMKGLSPFRITTVHLLKNSLLPVLSYLGPVTTNIFVGSFVVERIFAIPGLGQWLILSVLNRDYPVIGGLTLFYSMLLLAIHTIIDIIHTYLDPRIQLHEHLS